MSLTIPSNARGPILDLALPPAITPPKIVLVNQTTGKKLTLNLTANWNGDDLTLDFYRRTIKDQTGADRSALLDPIDNGLWLPNPLVTGANSVAIEAIGTPVYALTRSPGTLESVAGAGTAVWASPGNAKASDDVRATCALTAGATASQYLKATNYGFALPGGSTVVEIKPEVERSRSGVVCHDSAIRLVKGGVVSGSTFTLPSNWPTNDEKVGYGAHGLWGLSLALADVNAANFGFVISASLATAGESTPRIDHMPLTVIYSSSEYVATASLRWEKGYY